jgi:hypothetical protein
MVLDAFMPPWGQRVWIACLIFLKGFESSLPNFETVANARNANTA